MAKSKGKAAPHQMPAHPTINHPHNHPAHNVPTATKPNNENVSTPVMPPQSVAMANDYDNDGY